MTLTVDGAANWINKGHADLIICSHLRKFNFVGWREQVIGSCLSNFQTDMIVLLTCDWWDSVSLFGCLIRPWQRTLITPPQQKKKKTGLRVIAHSSRKWHLKASSICSEHKESADVKCWEESPRRCECELSDAESLSTNALGNLPLIVALHIIPPALWCPFHFHCHYQCGAVLAQEVQRVVLKSQGWWFHSRLLLFEKKCPWARHRTPSWSIALPPSDISTTMG